MEIRDQYHDPSFSMLYHLLNERPAVAAFVKSAELDVEAAESLPDAAFAWPEQRRFPINSAENTVISAMYREKCAAVPVEVDAMLQRAVEIYGVTNQLAQTKIAAAAPPPDRDEDYLLPRVHRLRVKTAEDVKVAEKLLLEQYPKLGIEDRAEGFINLVKKAQDFNVSLKPATHRMAGMTVCTTKYAMDAIEARAQAAKGGLFRQAYEKLATAFRGRDTINDRDELVAAADALAKLDKQAGLDRLYDKKLPDPIRTIFNTEKLSEEMVDLAGRPVALSKLAAMPGTFWSDVVGPDMSNEFMDRAGNVDSQKLGEVLQTLPLDLKMILKHQVP